MLFVASHAAIGALEKDWTPKKFAAFGQGWYAICSLEGMNSAYGYDPALIDQFKQCVKDAQDNIKLALAQVKTKMANGGAVAAAKNYYAAFTVACDELMQVPLLPPEVGQARVAITTTKLKELAAKFEAEL